MFLYIRCLKAVILYGVFLEFAASQNNTVARVGDRVHISWNVHPAVAEFDIKSITPSNGKLMPNESKNLFLVDEYTHVFTTINTHTENGTRIQLTVNTSLQGRTVVSLLFHSVDVQDAGVYQCVTYDSDRSANTRSQLLIVLQKPSQPNISTTSADPVSGGPVTLTCSSTSRSLPLDRSLYPYTLNTSYTWRRNNRRVESGVHVEGADLAIDKVTKGNKGVYTCQSEEEGVLSDWSQGYTPTVLYGPDTVQFNVNRDNVSAVEGDTLTVRCSADCNPACTVTWWDTSRQRVITGQREAVLYIPAVDRYMSGQYICHASNTHGNTSRNLTLDVFPVESPGAGAASIVYVAAVCSVLIVVIAVLVVVVAYKNRIKKGGEVYRVGDPNMGDNERQFQQDPSDLYAKVNKKRSRREGSEVYATVQKVISKQFTNRAFQGAAPSHERAVLINFPDQLKAESNNRGETNDDGLTYADLDLVPPTLIDGMSVIHSREEPVVYEEIDFSLTPGPQLPDKIWEVEEEEWEERRRQNFWE